MICSYCGKEIPDDSMFCNYCGKEVDLTGKCPNCRRDIPDGSSFCPFCGTALITPSIEDTIDENDQRYVYVCRQCKFVKFGYRNSKEICDYCYKPMVESVIAEEDWLSFDQEKKANCLNLILSGKDCPKKIEVWENSVFICPSCRKTWKSDDDAVIVRCPSCKAKLVNSFISGEKWDELSSAEKEKAKTDVTEPIKEQETEEEVFCAPIVETKDESNVANPVEDAENKSGSGWKILLGILAVLAVFCVVFSMPKVKYNRALNAYNEGNYTEAERLFSSVSDLNMDAMRYSLMSKARCNYVLTEAESDILVDSLDFEDCKDAIVSSTESFSKFLNGRWTTNNGYYIYMDIDDEGGSNIAYNIASPEVKHDDMLFDVKDGEVYLVTDDVDINNASEYPKDKCVKWFSISVKSDDKISIHNYANNVNYLFTGKHKYAYEDSKIKEATVDFNEFIENLNEYDYDGTRITTTAYVSSIYDNAGQKVAYFVPGKDDVFGKTKSDITIYAQSSNKKDTAYYLADIKSEVDRSIEWGSIRLYGKGLNDLDLKPGDYVRLEFSAKKTLVYDTEHYNDEIKAQYIIWEPSADNANNHSEYMYYVPGGANYEITVID